MMQCPCGSNKWSRTVPVEWQSVSKLLNGTGNKAEVPSNEEYLFISFIHSQPSYLQFLYQFHHVGAIQVTVRQLFSLSCAVWSPLSSPLSVSFLAFIRSCCALSVMPSLAFSALLCRVLYVYNYASISGLPGKTSPLIAFLHCLHPVIRWKIITT